MARFGFPISLDVSGRRCLVLGGDHEATDKAQKLARAGAQVQVIAAAVEPELAEAAERGEIAWAARDWEASDLTGAWLVMLTLEERDRGEEAFRLASREGALCCAIDQPDLCHFANPATFQIAELIVALSSGGRAPAVLRRLREDLEAGLATSDMADFVAEMSRMRDELPPGERIARLKEAVAGFSVKTEVTFPPWFQKRHESR